MNKKMISKTILEAYYRSEIGKSNLPMIGTFKDQVAVCPDGYRVFIMDKKDFIFDTEILMRGKTLVDFTKSLPKDGYKPAHKTDELRAFNCVRAKETAVKIANSTSYVWINAQYLKPYDSKDVTFEIVDQKRPVLVYEEGILVGFILPLTVKEEK